MNYQYAPHAHFHVLQEARMSWGLISRSSESIESVMPHTCEYCNGWLNRVPIFAIFLLLVKLAVKPSNTFVTISYAYKLTRSQLYNHKLVSYYYNAVTFLNIHGFATICQSFSDGSEEKVSRSNIRLIHISQLTDHGLNPEFVKGVGEFIHQKKDEYFLIPSLEIHYRELSIACPAQCKVIVSDVGVTDDVVSAVLEIDDDWDLNDADVFNAIAKKILKTLSTRASRSLPCQERKHSGKFVGNVHIGD